MSGAVIAALLIDPYALSGINWADIPTGGTHSNADQTQNAGATVTLQFSHALGDGTLKYVKNGGAQTGANNLQTVSWAPGDTLHFVAVASASGGTVTIKNNSDGAVTVDTFTVTFP